MTNTLAGCHGDIYYFSVEHIIERYMKEEIVASQRLKAPLPPLKDKASICYKLGISFCVDSV